MLRGRAPARRIMLSDGTVLDVGACADTEVLTRNGLVLEGSAGGGGGGGDNITVNASAATDANFNDTTPVAPAGDLLVKWQKSGSGPASVSAYVDVLDLQALLPYLTTTAAALTYVPQTALGAVSGVATLNGSSLVVENPANATATPTASKIPIATAGGKLDGWISAATTSAVGLVELATDGETAASVVVQGNDSRLSNDRTASGVRETAGPTLLVAGSIPDGWVFKRVGSTMVGVNPATLVGANEWALIASMSAPVSNEFAFTGLSLSTYKEIRIDIAGVTVTTDNTVMNLRLSVAGSEVTANYRYYVRHSSTSGTTPVIRSSASDGEIQFDGSTSAWTVGNAAAFSFNGSIALRNPGSATLYKQGLVSLHYVATTGNAIMAEGPIMMDNAGAITGLRLYGSSALLVGDVRIYGRA